MLGKVVMVALVCFVILFILSTEGYVKEANSGWLGNWTSDEKQLIEDQPPREFKEKCTITYKAFHFFKNNEDKWACKLDDGRVLVEGERKPRL